jgi:hemolysin III
MRLRLNSVAYMNTEVTTRYSLAEDVASSVTHGIGAGLGLAALAVLVTLGALHGDTWKVVGFSIYGACLVLLYLFSTFYHSFRSPRLKRIFRYLDHSAIYLLIAGTYTPFLLVNLRGPWGWSLFGVIWGLAVIGIVFNFVLMGRSRLLAGLVYIGMGWLVLIAIKPLVASVPSGGIAWLAAGGLSYTFGVIFYVWKQLPFNHTIWHLFVLGGSLCHFVAIFKYVLYR